MSASTGAGEPTAEQLLDIRLRVNGVVRSARASFVSVTPVPTVLDLTPALAGSAAARPLSRSVADAVVELVRGHVDPEADIHASADYRRMLAAELTRRAVTAVLGDDSAEGAA